DFAGRRLNFFVTGWGTGGTLTGAGEMIKLARPEVKIVATEPAGAALLSGKEWQPHKIQGWTPNLVPAVLNAKSPIRSFQSPMCRQSPAQEIWQRRKASSAAF